MLFVEVKGWKVLIIPNYHSGIAFKDITPLQVALVILVIGDR
jgi:hypothetical protein